MTTLGLGKSWRLPQGSCSGRETTNFACLFIFALILWESFLTGIKIQQKILVDRGKFEWITLLMSKLPESDKENNVYLPTITPNLWD